MWITLKHVDGYPMRINFNNVAFFRPNGEHKTYIYFASPQNERMYINIEASFDEIDHLLELTLRNG